MLHKITKHYMISSVHIKFSPVFLHSLTNAFCAAWSVDTVGTRGTVCISALLVCTWKIVSHIYMYIYICSTLHSLTQGSVNTGLLLIGQDIWLKLSKNISIFMQKNNFEMPLTKWQRLRIGFNGLSNAGFVKLQKHQVAVAPTLQYIPLIMYSTCTHHHVF